MKTIIAKYIFCPMYKKQHSQLIRVDNTIGFYISSPLVPRLLFSINNNI